MVIETVEQMFRYRGGNYMDRCIVCVLCSSLKGWVTSITVVRDGHA